MFADEQDHLIDMAVVCEIVGLHQVTVYRLMKKGDFPAGVKLTAKTVRWWESEVRAWLRSRPRTIRVDSRVLTDDEGKDTAGKSAA